MPERDPPDDFSHVLRELTRDYASINWAYFRNRLQPTPLSLSDDRSRLGCFVPEPRRIELSRDLIAKQSWGAVVEVLKHEMAHQFVYEVLGHHDEPSHGPSFQRVCEQLGIDPHASGIPTDAPLRTPILERIKKLLALASSPNEHEAETAMRMAHRLMLQHNLSHVSAEPAVGSAYGFRHLGRYSGRVWESDRLLAGLLGEFFFVQPIWVSVFRVADDKRVSVLEVTGRPDNLDMAEYVHGFLQHASESLWREHKRLQGIRSDVDRRAFLAGVMRGFADKLRAERKVQEASGLVWVGDPVANQYFRRRHPRVRTTSFGTSVGTDAGKHGRAAGRELVLNRPLVRGNSATPRALPK
jgi:predicted SprT family Zn-dependent metalloprotease